MPGTEAVSLVFKSRGERPGHGWPRVGYPRASPWTQDARDSSRSGTRISLPTAASLQAIIKYVFCLVKKINRHFSCSFTYFSFIKVAQIAQYANF
jgi:hypothetical protein